MEFTVYRRLRDRMDLVVPMTKDGVSFIMRVQMRNNGALNTPIRWEDLMYTQDLLGTANTALTTRLLDALEAFQVPPGRQRIPMHRMLITDR